MSHFTRRKHNHDYRGVCSYHMIFHKGEATPDFGELRTHPYKAPKDDNYAFIYYSELGRIILKEIYNIPIHQPLVKVTQYVVMPDHVHLLIRVMDRLPHHIGFYMGLFMSAVTRKWRLYNGADSTMPKVFKGNYTDRPIYNKTRYEIAKKYIKDNPYRLVMRRVHPEFFRDEVEKGGVLVSPFIAPLEKKMRMEAVEKGGRIIHIQKDAFGDRYKPTGADFELCCKRQLLIIAPIISMGKDISQNICYKMNKIAEEIVKGNFTAG